MDLIYMNDEKEDIGIMQNYELDLAFGADENDFEITTDLTNHVCKAGYIIYAEGTEYGGVINKIRVNTATDQLVYVGDTWHGILTNKILEPDSGEDYLICDGEANTVLAQLITRLSLGDLFKASTENSNIDIDEYKMYRYIDGYTGIKNMLKSVGCKLKVSFENAFVVLSCVPLVDYSTNEEFDSSQISFQVEKNYKPVNHVICLGQGELAEREVIHLFADENGNISDTQSQFGIDEVCTCYENVNCESTDELEQGGKDLLESSWNSDSLQVDFDSSQNYDIGDIVGARENITDVFISQAIVKKIVSIQNDIVTISHEVGEI